MQESYEEIYNYNFCCECGSPPNITFENMLHYLRSNNLEKEHIGRYCGMCPRWICNNCAKNNDICSCCRSGGDYRKLEQIQITDDIKKYIDKYKCINCKYYLSYNKNFLNYKYNNDYGYFIDENGLYDFRKCIWYCSECVCLHRSN